MAPNLGEVAVEVFAEGSVIAEFDEDGTVTYAFRGWKVGNTTFTKAAIEEFADLTGFVSTESNGSARGTWRIENGLLVLIVGRLRYHRCPKGGFSRVGD